MKVRPVFYVLGWLLVGLSLAMFLPGFVALSEGDSENVYVFFSSAVLTTFFAGGLIISLRGYEAQRILEGEGFKNVKFMDGGIMAWPYEIVTQSSQ